jgi:hypothetical protein
MTLVWTWTLLLLLLGCLQVVEVQPFALHAPSTSRLGPQQQQTQQNKCPVLRLPSRLPVASNTNNDKDDADVSPEEQVQRMEELILSLSLVADDAPRRDKVAQVLAAQLDQPNVDSSKIDRFIRLFEQRLTLMGEQVQTEARAAAAQRTAAEGEETVASEEENTRAKQLWALVDIMVQSKVIFKKQQQTQTPPE